MNSNSISYTVQHRYLELALRRHGESFVKLDQEMANFVAMPKSHFVPLIEKRWAERRALNPHLTDEQFAKFVEAEIDASANERVQFSDKFSDQFMVEAIPIVLLSHSLLEATINAALALGLHHAGKVELFTMIEKQEVKQKWELGPNIFLDGYVLRKGTSLFDRLNKLTKLRNAWLHSKIELQGEGNSPIIKGSNENRMEISSNGRTLVKSFLQLPYELHKNLCNQATDVKLQFLLSKLLQCW